MARIGEDDFKFPDEQEVTAKTLKPDELDVSVVGDDGTDGGTDDGIAIVDDTPEADRNRPPLNEEVLDPTDEEVAQYSAKVQDRIKKLTHARHDERRAKEALLRERNELERIARTAIDERDKLKDQLGKGMEVATSQAKTIATSEVEDAKQKLKAAHESFDTDAIVAAQMELNAAQFKLSRVENFKPPVAQTTELVLDSRSTAQDTAPKLDDRTATWMSKNKWFGDGGDSAMTGYALGLHQDLVAKHGDAYTRTDEYFSRIDKAMRQTFPDKFAVKRPDTIVAPAGRVSGARKVQLTQTQAAMAKKFGMTLQQYAAEVLKLEQ